MNDSRTKYVELRDPLMARVIRWIGVFLFFGGILVLGLQILNYLKTGEWFEADLILLAGALQLHKLIPWLDNPTSWYGLHDIVIGLLEAVPLAAFGIIAGIFMMLYEPKRETGGK